MLKRTHVVLGAWHPERHGLSRTAGSISVSAVSAVSLFFIGAVLFCNGLTLLGKIQPKGAAPVNALVGIVLVAASAHLGVPYGATEADLVGAAGFLLFAITYLWVALNSYTGHDPAGLGWYCAWATAVSAFLGLVTVSHLDDDKFALLWLLWAVLFAVFFVVIALDRQSLAYAAGWLAILEAIFTASGPGGLEMIGRWEDLATGWVVLATAIVLGGFAAVALRRRAVPAA